MIQLISNKLNLIERGGGKAILSKSPKILRIFFYPLCIDKLFLLLVKIMMAVKFSLDEMCQLSQKDLEQLNETLLLFPKTNTSPSLRQNHPNIFS